MKKRHLLMTIGLASTLVLAGCALKQSAVEVGAANVTSCYVRGTLAAANVSGDWVTGASVGTITGSECQYLNVNVKTTDEFKFVANGNWLGYYQIEASSPAKSAFADQDNLKVSAEAKFDFYIKDTSIYVDYAEKDDPSAKTNEFYVYDKAGKLGETFANINVFGFGQADTIKPMDWPGVHTGITTKTLGSTSMYHVVLSVSYPKFIMNNGTYQTADIEDLEDHIGDVLVIYEDNIVWRKTDYYTNVPAEDGYYLVGDETDWSFTNAPKLSADTVDGEHNHARLLRYSAAKDEEFKVYGHFDGETTYFGYGEGQENYKAAAAGLVNVFASKDGHIYVDSNDMPAADGYFLQIDSEGWDYAHAVSMPAYTQAGNVAKLTNIHLIKDEEIRVRSYFTNRVTFQEWGTGHANDLGTIEGDNFKFKATGDYDIFAKIENDALQFYVAETVKTYQVEMTAVKYVGATKEGTAALPTQEYYTSDPTFTPTQEPIEGYVFNGFYTEEACENAYVPVKLNANDHLYAKYIKVGFYVTHGPSWSIEDAEAMLTSGIDAGNKAEAYLTVSAANETYSFVYYNASGVQEGHSGLGQEYAYATDEDSHIKFTKAGTYAVYWSDSDNKIYLNSGAVAFYTTFITETGAECKGSSTDKAALKAVWLEQKTAYEHLDPTDAAEIAKLVYGPGDQDGSIEERFMARYYTIVQKYGTAEFVDFIWNQNIAGKASSPMIFGNNSTTTATNNAMMIAIISVIALVSVASVVTIIVIKKKSHN